MFPAILSPEKLSCKFEFFDFRLFNFIMQNQAHVMPTKNLSRIIAIFNSYFEMKRFVVQ